MNSGSCVTVFHHSVNRNYSRKQTVSNKVKQCTVGVCNILHGSTPRICLSQCKAIPMHTICHTSSADMHHYEEHTECTEILISHMQSFLPLPDFFITALPRWSTKWRCSNSDVCISCEVHTLLSRSALQHHAVHRYKQPVKHISAAL